MNETEAKEIARAYLSNAISLELCPDQPQSFYRTDPLDNYLFFRFDLFHPSTVGGVMYIAVSKTTGQVAFAGSLGE